MFIVGTRPFEPDDGAKRLAPGSQQACLDRPSAAGENAPAPVRTEHRTSNPRVAEQTEVPGKASARRAQNDENPGGHPCDRQPRELHGKAGAARQNQAKDQKTTLRPRPYLNGFTKPACQAPGPLRG